MPASPRHGREDTLPPQLGLLEMAVPMWIERFRPMAWEERMKIRDECLAGLGMTDDGALLDGIAAFAGRGANKPGRVAGAFTTVAKALALGALQPGGVSFAGMHFEAAS